jgi:hypothetical protein
LHQEWKMSPGALWQYSCMCLCGRLLHLSRWLITPC